MSLQSYRQYEMMACELTEATTRKSNMINDCIDISKKIYNLNSDIETSPSRVSFLHNETGFMFLNDLNKE